MNKIEVNAPPPFCCRYDNPCKEYYSYHRCYYYYCYNHYNGHTKGYLDLLHLLSFLLCETIHTPLLSPTSSHSSQKKMSTKATQVDTYPMETLSSMVVVKRRDNEPDYQHDSKSNRDEIELAHFGKRQQLKVNNSTDHHLPLLQRSLLISISFARGLSVSSP